MCTTARLVQGDKISDWFGMPMSGAPVPDANFTVEPGQPAFLEVKIDPAAHGEAGLGPITRGVNLQTAGGQQFAFQLAAQVVR
ncbi:MAG: hypothetical protein J0I20_32750 [Chloroflexi bacterium]|nr:hypothetical protein [Chloroflexota bacterium]OJV91763.1 MAG: hypothetical protein BGO39_17875 [Chloroflexi bacterium 54-19]